MHRNAVVKFGLAVATHCMKAADSMLPGSLCCMIHFSNGLNLRFGMLWKRKPSGVDKLLSHFGICCQGRGSCCCFSISVVHKMNC